MTIHDDAEAARRKVYDDALASLRAEFDAHLATHATTPTAPPANPPSDFDPDGLSFDKTLLPFKNSSPWRLPISTTAVFAGATDPRNVAMGKVEGNGQAWCNYDKYSHPISFATTTSPLAAVTDSMHSRNGIPVGGTWDERIPATARIAAGTDKHMHVVTPDGRYALEHFGTVRQSPTAYTCTRRHRVDLTGGGIGEQNGTRANGGSAVAGLIRRWEVDPKNPAYTGVIAHPLAIALRADQLHYNGLTKPQQGFGATFGADGHGLAQGHVWPATEQDADSAWSYTGPIPMGAYFAIPPNVDITALGLATPAALMVAKAMQDYGVYVTDRSGVTALYIEDDGGTAQATTPARDFFLALTGPSYTGTDLRRLFKALRVVTNNTAATPNGGSLSAARRGSSTSA